MTSSAKIARTGFSFARDYLPPSPIASPIFRSTGEEDELETEFEPPASNGADPLEALAGATYTASEPGYGAAVITELATEPEPTLGEMEELRFTKLSEKATLPDAGARQRRRPGPLRRRERRIVPGAGSASARAWRLRFRRASPGLVLPRSGLALKHGVTLVNSPGLIDPGYRGEVRVLLLNTDQTIDFQCAPGDRIAQLMLVPIATASPMQADALDTSDRAGSSGFGSSGL